MLSAAERSLADRVSLVLALAPLSDVSEAIRSITTDVYRDGDALVRFAPGDFFRLVIARSVISCLEPGDDRTALRSHLLALEDYGAEPIAGLRTWPRESLGDPARAAVALLSNEDPDRFDGLFAALAGGAPSRACEAMSPLAVAGRDHRAGRARRRPRGQVHPSRRRDIVRRGVPEPRDSRFSSRSRTSFPTVSPTAVRDLARLDRVLVALCSRAVIISAMIDGAHGLPRLRQVRPGRQDLRARADRRRRSGRRAGAHGSGSRGSRRPVVASRTERTILHDMGHEGGDSVLLDQALDLAERLAAAAEEGRVDLGDLGRRARRVLAATARPSETEQLF